MKILCRFMMIIETILKCYSTVRNSFWRNRWWWNSHKLWKLLLMRPRQRSRAQKQQLPQFDDILVVLVFRSTFSHQLMNQVAGWLFSKKLKTGTFKSTVCSVLCCLLSLYFFCGTFIRRMLAAQNNIIRSSYRETAILHYLLFVSYLVLLYAI